MDCKVIEKQIARLYSELASMKRKLSNGDSTGIEDSCRYIERRLKIIRDTHDDAEPARALHRLVAAPVGLERLLLGIEAELRAMEAELRQLKRD